MRTHRLLITLFALSLQACRSGHFEDRTTQLQESNSAFSIEVVRSNSIPIASVNRSKATHVDMSLQMKTRDTQVQLVRNQALTIKIDHSSLLSGSSLIARTDDQGRFDLPMDLSPNEDGPTAESYDIRIQIQTQSFGTTYGLISIDLRHPEALGRWQESSRAQFEQALPFDLRIEVSPQAFLKSSKQISQAQRMNMIEVGFQIFRSDKTPLINTPIRATLRSESANLDFSPTTDERGNIALTFDVPYSIYGPFDPFIGLITIDVSRPEGKISKSRAVLISLPDNTSSQILSVISRNSISDLQPSAKDLNDAKLQIEIQSLRRGDDQISSSEGLDLQQSQSLNLRLRLKVRRQNSIGANIEKVLESVPVSGQWIVTTSPTNDLKREQSIVQHSRFQSQTNELGVLQLSTKLQYKDLKTTGWPTSILLALQIDDIVGLPTTFIEISESNLNEVAILNRDDADSILGGALIRGPSSDPQPAQPVPSDRPYLKNLISLSDVFAKSSTFSKDRQSAITQLQEVLKTLPNPGDADAVRNLYLLLAKVVNVSTSDASHSFRWDELIFIGETTRHLLRPGAIDDDFKAQLNRISSFDLRAYNLEIVGTGHSCLQFSLWKPGTVPPNEEWVKLYWCAQEPRSFNKILEPYLLITPSIPRDETRLPNFLIRGYGDLQNLRAKVMNSKSNLDDSNILELLKAHDQYSLPDRRGLTIRPVYPVSK